MNSSTAALAPARFRVCLAFLLVGGSAALADEPPAQEARAQPYTVSEVVIEAAQDRKEAAIHAADRVAPTVVLSGPEMKRLGAANAADALSLVPGLSATGPSNAGDRLENVGVRGFGSEYTLVLVDGERVASRSVDGKFDLAAVGIDQIERIEVTKGPQALGLGADAIGGVINIVTRAPADRWRAQVSAGYGSLAIARTAATVEGPLAQGVTMRVFGRFETAPGWTDAYDLDRALRQTTVKDDRRATRKGEAQLDLAWKALASTTARLSLRYFKGLADVDRTAHRYVEAGTEHGLDDRDDFSATLKVTSNPRWGGRFDGSLRVFGAWLTKDRERDLLHQSGARFLYREASTEAEKVAETLVAGRVTYTHPIGRHLLTGWLEGRWQRRQSFTDGRQQRFDARDILVSDIVRKRPDKIYDKDEPYFVVGLEDEVEFGPHGVSAGVRFEDTASWPAAVTPSISGRLALSDGASLRASAGLGYRLPHFEYRTRSPVPELDLNGTRYTAGNPDLRPEQSRSLQLVFEHAPAGWFAYSATGFVNQLFDRIDKRIEDDYLGTGLPLERPVNIGRAWTAGAEVEARLRPSKHFSARASYAYLWSLNAETNRPLNEVPTHTASLSLDGRLPRQGLDASLSVLYVSPRPRIDAVTGLERADSPVGQLLQGQARVGFAFTRDLRADVDVSNLFNTAWDRDNDGDSDMPPFSLFARLTWKYDNRRD
ncbi:MAG: TonB-dependent receptor [Myxococcota bacterium]|jgi:outer membrane receptor for ferrienterochelin and colicins